MTDVGDAVRGPWTWRLRGLLTVLCVAQALEVLGVTVVIVALPAIGTDLGLATAELQLVVTVYAVLYGGLLLTAGRVCDILDRRRVFAAGLGLTLVGAACCALAPTGATLLVGRAIHGLGGAVVTPAALSLLTSTFREGPKRSVAVRAWTAAAAGGGAAGLVVGGLVVDATGWRGVFWLLTPVAALALVGSWLVLPASLPTSAARSLDLPGSVTATTGLVLLVWGAGLVEDPATAVVHPAVPVAAGLALLGVFLVLERRGREPLIAWSELTDRAFMTPNAVAFVNTATTSAAGTLVALVASRVLGLDARATGLVLLPFSVLVMVGSLTGSWWLRRPARTGMAAGLAVVTVAMLSLAAATAARSVAGLAVAVAVAGLGLSWAAVTSTSAATRALPDDRQGIASGAVNTAAQIGTALGVAVLLAVASVVGVDGRSTGYTVAFVAAGCLAGVTALLLVRTASAARPGP